MPLQRLHWPELEALSINVYLRRDDAISPLYSGNKFYKLYYNFRHATTQGADAIVSFGGNYSNHLYSLAAMGQELGIQTIGIVRGYESAKLSPTLEDAKNFGMKLYFLGKKAYKFKDISELLPILNKKYGGVYIVPEGGENLAGVRGCMAMGTAIDKQMFNLLGDSAYTLCCAVGTGSTFAGLIASSPRAQCLGITVLKGKDTISPKVTRWLSLIGKGARSNWSLNAEYHHGGYAKVTPQLLEFMSSIESLNTIKLDPVYTAKLLWAIKELATAGYWNTNNRETSQSTHIVAVHSGGLQGRRGFDLT